MQSQHKLTRILTAAQAQFIVPGFADTKMLDIAKGADIAVGTLYTLVNSKTDLLTLLFATTLDPTMIDATTAFPWQPLSTVELVARTKHVYQQTTQQLLTQIQAAPADQQFKTLITRLFDTFDQFGAYFLILERNPKMNPTLMSLYRHYRHNLYQATAQILTQLTTANVIRSLSKPAADALIIIDEIFWWSAHKKYDSFERAATTIDHDQLKTAVIQQLLTSYQHH